MRSVAAFVKIRTGVYYPYVKIVWATYYTYDEPIKGNSKAAPIPNSPTGHKRAAVIHTHATFQTKACDNLSLGDRNIARDFKVPIYLANPKGELRIYDPDYHDILSYTIFYDLPSNPNHPKEDE